GSARAQWLVRQRLPERPRGAAVSYDRVYPAGNPRDRDCRAKGGFDRGGEEWRRSDRQPSHFEGISRRVLLLELGTSGVLLVSDGQCSACRRLLSALRGHGCR